MRVLGMSEISFGGLLGYYQLKARSHAIFSGQAHRARNFFGRIWSKLVKIGQNAGEFFAVFLMEIESNEFEKTNPSSLERLKFLRKRPARKSGVFSMNRWLGREQLIRMRCSPSPRSLPWGKGDFVGRGKTDFSRELFESGHMSRSSRSIFSRVSGERPSPSG